MRLKNLEDILQDLSDFVLLLVEPEIESLPYEIQNMVKVDVLTHFRGDDGSEGFKLLHQAAQDSVDWRVPRLDFR
jgi:hypothetical protein